MVVTCMAMAKACLALVATSCSRTAFLLMAALDILSMLVSDLDGFSSTEAAFDMLNLSAPPQAWICL